ncbi:hypothetical protein JD844_005753 [Phrynosoma platyrhinos]|uniref:UPAR/Ly6 domain-containing protein n=1 Tax=Phrynosoma platyrhinos TaxID=52577 RepID=A0ABQ7TPR7_PHRPL|nr:hypothetical protein JD844_005753 [Phrynosoma platyrhinos]
MEKCSSTTGSSLLRAVELQTGFGNSLWCTSCSREGTWCSGNKVICDRRVRSCFVSRIENTLDRERKLMTVEGCAPSSICKHPLQYLNIGQGLYELTSFVCCVGDACKTAAPRSKYPGS